MPLTLPPVFSFVFGASFGISFGGVLVLGGAAGAAPGGSGVAQPLTALPHGSQDGPHFFAPHRPFNESSRFGRYEAVAQVLHGSATGAQPQPCDREPIFDLILSRMLGLLPQQPEL
ncbi:hypothetical protein [Frigoriglobus tundricola]|uniref:hypothetical protein n=1 Tax=Frigoriglobus tundricola TaxID=2774151 RepID=UPI00148EAD35|nr:hypothetical protein [Frigoriglobus tundricola]